jgi:hypothetical protein
MARTLVALAGGLAVIAGAIILGWQHQQPVSRLIHTNAGFLLAMLRDVLQLSLPFTLVMVWRRRDMIACLRRNWPLALFAVVTIYQPHSRFFHTGPDNALRIGMQGVWVFNLIACFLIIDRLQQRSAATLLRLPVLICPVLWIAMRILERYGVVAGIELWTARFLGAGLMALTVAVPRYPTARGGPSQTGMG